MIDLKQVKEKIVNLIRFEGPLLPVQISRKLDKDTIFAGAVLSELVKEKAVLVSHAKVGGSPIYYINGQESKLSMLQSYLPSKEKEAYELLRKNQILKDKECEPAIRVALRSIRDFSYPLEFNGELYWRWYLTNENEAIELIKMSVPKKTEIINEINKKEEKKEFILKEDKGDEFLNIVSSYLKNRKIQTTELIPIKKGRESEGKIKINSDLGTLDFLVIAKNKKTINEADISLANDHGKRCKLPVLFLSNGKMTKKCNKYLEENLKGRVIFMNI